MSRSKILGAATLLAVLVLTTAVQAQMDGGAAPMPMGGQTLPSNGQIDNGQMGGTPQGRRTGSPFGARIPFAAGTVSAVDATGGTVTLTPMFGGAKTQTMQISATTEITAQADVKISDLKVGDTVQVRGIPTGITATQITDGDSPDAPIGTMIGASRPGMIGGRQPGMGGPSANFASASGKITVLSPLTISLSDSVQVTLKVTAATTIRKNLVEKIGDLKPGDRILATGQTSEDGVFHATRLRVNGDYGTRKP